MTRQRFTVTILLVLLLVLSLTAQASARAAGSTSDRIKLTRKDLTDQKGRVFTETQILRMGVERFEKAWYGIYRDPPRLYSQIAAQDNQRRIQRLPPHLRKQMVQLRHVLEQLDRSVCDISYDMVGGGTAVLYDCLKLDATGEEFLRHLLLDLARLPKRSTRDRRHFAWQVRQIQQRLRRYQQHVKAPADKEGPPFRPEQFPLHLRALERQTEALTRLARRLPDGVTGRLALRLRQVIHTLDEAR